MVDRMDYSGSPFAQELAPRRREHIAQERIRLGAMGAALSLALLFGSAGMAAAHHSYSASYDLSRPVQIQGVIQELRYANPHVEFVVAASGADGSIVPWLVSTAGVSRAQGLGLTPEFLAAGQPVTVVGWPAWDGSLELGASTITVGDQTVVAHT
ncbi:MAG: DUF6152 family protein [Thermomicrobiales bacterium]